MLQKKTAASIGETRDNLLFGQDANGNRINSDSLSDYGSERFVSQIEGKVQIMAGDISPDSIFSQTEFPEVVSNNKITEVDGISKTDINSRFGELIHSGNSFDDAVSNIRQDITAESYVNTEANIKLIAPPDPISHVAGIDTGDFFGRTSDAPHINTIPEGSSNIHALAGLLDGSKLRSVESVLGRIGTAGDVLAVTIAVFHANEAYAAGDTAGAVHIMENWAANFVGGIGGGIVGVQITTALAGLLITSPPGIMIAGIVTLATMGAAIYGGIKGGELGEWLLEKGRELELYTQQAINDFVHAARDWWTNLEHTIHDIGDTLSHAYDAFLHAVTIALRIDPLIIDLNGNGIALNSWQTTNVLFDLNGDGTKEHTGWTKANGDDAFLVIDKNNDGKINDITEMFGSANTPGFADLRNYDSNKDGVINASDSQFSLLKLWNDKNANGVLIPALDAGSRTAPTAANDNMLVKVNCLLTA